jgi:hypothetical protein
MNQPFLSWLCFTVVFAKLFGRIDRRKPNFQSRYASDMRAVFDEASCVIVKELN